MAYEFKKLSDVTLLDSVPEGATVLAEVDGAIRRVPGDGLGGGGGQTNMFNNYWYPGVTLEWDGDPTGKEILSGIVKISDELFPWSLPFELTLTSDVTMPDGTKKTISNSFSSDTIIDGTTNVSINMETPIISIGDYIAIAYDDIAEDTEVLTKGVWVHPTTVNIEDDGNEYNGGVAYTYVSKLVISPGWATMPLMTVDSLIMRPDSNDKSKRYKITVSDTGTLNARVMN